MANNIQIVGNIIDNTIVSRYSPEDVRLISSQEIQENFGNTSDYIEYFIYDAGGNILNVNYNYLNYKLPSAIGLTPNNTTSSIGTISDFNSTKSTYSSIEIDPIQDLKNIGFSSGEFKVQYNFFSNRISDSSAGLFIKEISTDRTELRVGSTTLSNEELQKSVTDLINSHSGSTYFADYILNFGNNNTVLAVNTLLNTNGADTEILFKLYQPLPPNIVIKTSLWVVEEKVNPYIFDINLDTLILPTPSPILRGPNFDIELKNHGTKTTPYSTYDTLISELQGVQNSSFNQLSNLLNTQSIDINVDYSNFNNFVFFSSAYSRVNNFYGKVQQIENYNNLITTYTPLTASISSYQLEINNASSSITDIISNFDGFESFLYFESSSFTSSFSINSYPKSGSLKPYTLLSTGSAQSISWFSSSLLEATEYDAENYDNLINAVPLFISEDAQNQQYLIFLNMMGQYFDNIWIFLQSVTDVNLANNNLDKGISKDLVYGVLQSLGINVHNSFGDQSVNQFLLGANTGSSFFSGSLTDFSVTSSYLNNIPRKDLLAESYKRIYHNLPLLLKKKGTSSGLADLISTFGIPSRDYYAVDSSSFYNVTGSNLTSSILNVKEFGGASKNEILTGYNNDKIRIINNTITGSVLSSLISLQTTDSSSINFRNNDEHYIDVSFSPQTQIDTYISKSISANNPKWILDNYIGNPSHLYSSSYSDLVTQKDIYFRQGSGSFSGFTGSLLDYNGFIRLIQYFDNSLFKMLKDYVPARANLSTGITINSPVLERNKIPTYNPSDTTKIHVYTGNINSSSISSDYGHFYNSLSGDKKSFYSGDLSGSKINIYNKYFTPNNQNPYTHDFGVYNIQHSVTQSIDLNTFNHSDYNTLFNNISTNRKSSIRKKLELSGSFIAYIGSGSINLYTSASLQDSYLNLESYNRSRYKGSKTTSATYNTYTSASLTYPGDDSYGKTAAIDHKSLKVAWVKNIPSQSLNFNDKTSINLKYLVDSNNNLTELSFGNLNINEVQNIFKSGDPVILSISDVQQPSNQLTLDGTKNIWKGGYSFDPILYRESNESLNFISTIPLSSAVVNTGVKAFNSTDYGYSAYDGAKGNTIYQAEPSLGANGNGGNGGGYTFTVNGVNTMDTMAYAQYAINAWPYTSNIDFNPPPTQNPRRGNQYAYAFDLLNFNDTTNTLGGYNTEPLSATYSNAQNIKGKYYYNVPRTGIYQLNGVIPFKFTLDDRYGKGNNWGGGSVGFKTVGIVEISHDNGASWTYAASTTIQNVILPANSNIINIDANTSYVEADNQAGGSFECVLNNTLSLSVGTLVRFQFYLLAITDIFGVNEAGVSYGFSFDINGNSNSKAFFEIYDTGTTITQYNYNFTYNQLPSLFTTYSLNPNAVVFSSTAQNLFTSTFNFNPSLPASTNYTPVVDVFNIQPYDIFRIGAFAQPTSEYYEVRSTGVDTFGPNPVTYVIFDRAIDLTTFNSAQSFAILRPKLNETSVIINYKKQLGEVSQTILIPNDANDIIKGSVGNIFKTIKNFV